jgi:aspartyl-tRNA(Asn)/glutamyl-tRNA(Gln) amidotransferase subunit A
MDAWWREGVSAIGQALRERRLTSVELVASCLDRIRRIDPELNSFVAIDEVGARQAAREADARLAAGTPRSALDGIPVSVKDNILAAGLPATWGSRALADFRPERDELPVARLRGAGAIILGKTNVPELTLEGYTANELFGVTRNPWNPRLTPGGSSGGAVVSVAAGLVPAAIGTDGGGSIRRPASHCGLVGFKPSIGRVPRIDGFPVVMHDFEVVGPLTRSVADTILIDEVIAGPDARDRRSLYAPAPPWVGTRRRVRYIPHFGDLPVDAEVAAATAEVAGWLADQGHEVREEKVFFDLDAAGRIWHVVTRAGVAWLLARDSGRLGAVAGPSVRALGQEGAALSGADYAGALDALAEFRRRAAELFAGADLVLTPTAAALPWRAEETYPREIAGRAAGPRDHAVFTGWVNMAGHPAISLPAAVSRERLPIGVQFVGDFGADRNLLDFAAWFEARRPSPLLPERSG